MTPPPESGTPPRGDRNTHYQLLHRASWAGILGNGMLALIKITAGVLSSSLAVAGDGIDSLTDVVTSLVTLYAAKKTSHPPDPRHPWGYQRAEAIATKTLSFLIVLAGIQLLILTGQKLLGLAEPVMPTPLALGATLISVLGKFILTLYKYRVSKITGSAMMRMNAANTRNDIFLSLSVFAGVFFTLILKLPLLDILTGMGISFWIIYTGIKAFIDTNTELMDSIQDRSLYKKVFEAVEETPGASNPHRVRVRKLNALHVIDLDIEVKGALTLNEAHEISCQVENAIEKKIPGIYDIMVHMEPRGIGRHKEGYGLSLKDQ